MIKRSIKIIGAITIFALIIFGFQTLRPVLGFQSAETPTSTPAPVLANQAADTPTATLTITPSPTLIPATEVPTITPSPTVIYSQAEIYSACKNRVNVPDSELHWLYVPESAGQLATYIDYAFLAGKLIKSGAVDASTCPAGGLGAEGYANACGLARASVVVYELQNAYDEFIMDAWEQVGVPPVMLKQLLHHESQFWPGYVDEYHYGLGHLTYYGAHTGLTWWLPLRLEICSLTGTCDMPLVPDSEVYTLLGLMDATCPDCELRVDVAKAQRSIHYLAEVLLGHCYQTSQVVFNVTGVKSGAVVDYATIWKLTLLNYNAGPTCVFEAVKTAYAQNPSAMKWDNIKQYIKGDACIRGAAYVYQITEPFYDFPSK